MAKWKAVASARCKLVYYIDAENELEAMQKYEASDSSLGVVDENTIEETGHVKIEKVEK